MFSTLLYLATIAGVSSQYLDFNALEQFQAPVLRARLNGTNIYHKKFDNFFNKEQNLEECSRLTLQMSGKSFEFWIGGCYINAEDTLTEDLSESFRYNYYELKGSGGKVGSFGFRDSLKDKYAGIKDKVKEKAKSIAESGKDKIEGKDPERELPPSAEDIDDDYRRYDNAILAGYSSYGRGEFTSFEPAMEQCDDTADCGGITYQYGVYTLRLGSEPVGQSFGNVISYAKRKDTGFRDKLSGIKDKTKDKVSGIKDKAKDKVKDKFNPLKDKFEEKFPPQIGVSDGKVGRRLKEEEGLNLKHPVVFIPGFTTTTLELWQGPSDCPHSLGDALWGGEISSKLKAVTKGTKCWFRQMALNFETGLDPVDTKVRALDGFAGAMQFIKGYWIWNRVVENLVEVGYDINTMHMAAYDWRLSYEGMEKRDKTLSKLKFAIETSVNLNGQKVVLVTHSMGSGLALFFLQWVESDLGGKGGKDWVSKHIHATTNIAGAYLGMPKTVATLTSGEMRGTAMLGDGLNNVLEAFKLTSRLKRVNLFQSWPSLSQMLPKGGDALWQDDKRGFGPLLYSNKDSCPVLESVSFGSFRDWLPKVYPRMNYSLNRMSSGYSKHPTSDDPKKWYNPLETPLPNAPEMTLYSFYGVNKPTERSYYYQCDEDETGRPVADHVPYFMDTNVDSDDDEINGWKNGVKLSDGDGTIPLISLGYLPVKQWKTKSHNPFGVKIVTHELKHQPHPLKIRGGDKTSDHVDVLGNYELIESLVKIACGVNLHEDVIHSDIVSQANDAFDRLNA